MLCVNSYIIVIINPLATPFINTPLHCSVPYFSKYLLIAAYLASYNSTDKDQQFFSQVSGWDCWGGEEKEGRERRGEERRKRGGRVGREGKGYLFLISTIVLLNGLFIHNRLYIRI